MNVSLHMQINYHHIGLLEREGSETVKAQGIAGMTDWLYTKSLGCYLYTMFFVFHLVVTFEEP